MTDLDYFERTLDNKNRLTIPAEIRSEFKGGEVVITRGFGKYLHLYSKSTWETQMESALRGDILDERVADLNVKFRTGKSNAVLDGKQGRVTLEDHLLKYAGIKRQIVAVRAGSYWRLTAKPQ